MGKKWVNDSFKQILVDNCQAYLESNNLNKTTGRTQLIDEVVEKIREASGGHGLPENLNKAVATWFGNEAKSVVGPATESPSKSVPKGGFANPGKRWTTRGVAKDLFPDRFKEIHARHMEEYTGEGKANLRTTAAALSELMSSLDNDELEECRRMGESWNMAAAPKEVQQKATKRLPALAKKFVATAQKDMGVKVFMLVSYKNGEGKDSISCFENQGSTFRVDRPNWRKGTGNIVDLWKAWLQEEEEEEEDEQEDEEEDDETEGHGEKKKGRQVKLQHRVDDGYPLLPAVESDLSLRQAKGRLRQYVREVRGSQEMQGRIPWAAIGASNSNHMETECRCEGHNLGDPSRMTRAAVFAFLTHWRHRQEQGEQWPLRFVRPDNGNPRDSGGEEGGQGSGTSGKGKGIADNGMSPGAVGPTLRRPFLISLSKHSAYQDLLELLDTSDPVSGHDPVELFRPLWGQWEYSKAFLPPDFHIRDGPSSFSAVLEWIKFNPLAVVDGGLPSYSYVERTLLVLGLTLREFDRVLFTDEETSEDLPGYVRGSDITIMDWDRVVQACDDLLLKTAENGDGPEKSLGDGDATADVPEHRESPTPTTRKEPRNRGPGPAKIAPPGGAVTQDSGKRSSRARVTAIPRAAGPPTPERRKRGRAPDNAGKATKKARR